MFPARPKKGDDSVPRRIYLNVLNTDVSKFPHDSLMCAVQGAEPDLRANIRLTGTFSVWQTASRDVRNTDFSCVDVLKSRRTKSVA